MKRRWGLSKTGEEGRGTEKYEMRKLLTFKGDFSSGLPSSEAERVTVPVSSTPRPLSFLHMSPGSLYLLAFSKRIQNHSSDINKV